MNEGIIARNISISVKDDEVLCEAARLKGYSIDKYYSDIIHFFAESLHSMECEGMQRGYLETAQINLELAKDEK